MPTPNRDGVVSYLAVETKDEARAKKMVEEKTAGHGITIESVHARIDETFPADWQGQKGKKMAFLSSSDDNKFRLGASEIMPLQDAGMMAGMLRDNRGTVQNAREDGRSVSKAQPK